MIILDTNVVSELMRATPSTRVVEWINQQPVAALYTTTLTQAEIFLGVALLPRGRKRDAIAASATAVFDEDFAGRVLPFASDAARAFAEIAAARRKAGRPIATVDAQIAAVARAVDADLATRNVDDFDGCGIHVVDPWND